MPSHTARVSLCQMPTGNLSRSGRPERKSTLPGSTAGPNTARVRLRRGAGAGLRIAPCATKVPDPTLASR